MTGKQTGKKKVSGAKGASAADPGRVVVWSLDKNSALPRCVDFERFERAVRELLEAAGEDPGRDGLLGTPGRVARMYAEILSGADADPGRHLATTFAEDHHEMVVVKDIPFESLCEHHLMPFHGKASVAYVPNGRIVGLSKVARVVEEYARRLQVQERLTSQIADTLWEHLAPEGVGVILEATHTCMTMRGVRKPGSAMVTSAVRGTFKSRPDTRAEFMHLVGR